MFQIRIAMETVQQTNVIGAIGTLCEEKTYKGYHGKINIYSYYQDNLSHLFVPYIVQQFTCLMSRFNELV